MYRHADPSGSFHAVSWTGLVTDRLVPGAFHSLLRRLLYDKNGSSDTAQISEPTKELQTVPRVHLPQSQTLLFPCIQVLFVSVEAHSQHFLDARTSVLMFLLHRVNALGHEKSREC